MCQQVQTVTLQTAILQQVAEFAANNTVFSVHDITVAVRSKTSAGELEIPEVEVQGASFRFDIPHSKVKALFDELYRTGVFDPNYRLDRAFNGTYFEYTPTTLNTTAPTPVPTAIAPTPVSTVTTTGAVSHSIRSRVNLYLKNCAARKFQPTLRQVQSAIKRSDFSSGFSCEDLKDIIENQLGYPIVTDPTALSRAQVVTN